MNLKPQKYLTFHLFVLSSLHMRHVIHVSMSFLCHLHEALVLLSFPIKMCFEVRSSRVLPTRCRKSLMCFPSPLIIMLIKISLIFPPLSLHQILFMLFTAHIHAGSVMCFLCSVYLQHTQGAFDLW